MAFVLVMCRDVCNLFVFLCFQSGGRGATSSAEIGMEISTERLVAPGCHQVDWLGKVEIVSKTGVYFGMKRSVIELLVVRGMLKWSLLIFFCVVTMIGGTINIGTECHPLTCPGTPKSTVIGQRILGHFQNKVSNVAVKVGGE